MKLDGINYQNCEELSKLVQKALEHMPNPDLERELMYFNFGMIRGVEMTELFESLVNMSIVMISSYIYPMPEEYF